MDEKLEKVLPEVTKPSRYLGNEWNAVHKDHRQVEVKVALGFPDVYEVGMSHLGLHILYYEINRREDAVAERVFAPWTDMEELMRERDLPLYALESRRPVREFDIIGFTLQYEMSYTNILNMLDLAGVPLYSRERGPDDPLVIAGGPCTLSAEPLAPFMDLLVLGDGEEVIHEILDTYRQFRRQLRKTGMAVGRSDGVRRELLRVMASIDGVYVPSLYRVEYKLDGTIEGVFPVDPDVPARPRRRVVRDLDAVEGCPRPIVPYLDVVHDRAVVEVFRGCTRGCRFCQAGIIYRPVRERSPEKVKEIVARLVEETGHDEISLASLSTADYSAVEETIEDLVREYGERGIGISLPSLRVDTFSVGLAQQVQRVRKVGLTFAPEAGTQRLRDVINKGVTGEDLLEAAEAAFRAGWTRLKLYFMVGLPTETTEDIEGIARLAYRVLEVFDRVRSQARQGEKKSANRGQRGRNLRLTVSTSCFVPKAHTPFQWEAQLALEELRRRQKYLASLLRDRRVEYDWHDPDLSMIEAVFSRGDRRLAPVLERAWRLGCKFDGWSDHFHFDLWLQAFRETGVDPGFYALRERDLAEVLPWDHLEVGVTKDFLRREYARSRRGEPSRDCRFWQCTDCGVCPGLGVSLRLKSEQGFGCGR